MLERNKRHIYAEKFNRFLQILRRDIADIRAFHIDDALVGAQAPRKLPIAHVHGVYLDGAVLQHTIGKAAGGGTNVHADLAVRPHREHLHGLFQLESAAADIADIVPAHLDLGIGGDHLARLVCLLLVDKDDAGHDQRLGAFAALHQPVLAQVLIQTYLTHCGFSSVCSRARQSAAASSFWSARSSGTLACKRCALSTACSR